MARVTTHDGCLLQVSIRKISQMALLFHLYFVVGSGSRYWYDSNAFLFSFVNKPGWAPVRLPQTGKYSSSRKHSIEDTRSNGPTFGGGHDIKISDFVSSNRNSFSNLGYTYSPPTGVHLQQYLRPNIPGRNIRVQTRGNRNVL